MLSIKDSVVRFFTYCSTSTDRNLEISLSHQSVLLSPSRWIPNGSKHARTVKFCEVTAHLFILSCISPWHLQGNERVLCSFCLYVCVPVDIHAETREWCRIWVSSSITLGLIIPMQQCLSLNLRFTMLCWLGWVVSQLLSSPFQCWDCRHIQSCLVCIWMLGIWTQLLMLAQQVLQMNNFFLYYTWIMKLPTSSMTSNGYYY